MIRNSIPKWKKRSRFCCDSRRKFLERRFLDELLFTKCEKEEVVEDLQAKLTTKLVDVFHNGEKVYVVPNLSKGMCCEKTSERDLGLHIYHSSCGDSESDASGGRKGPGLVPAGFKRFAVMVSLQIQRDRMEMGRKIVFWKHYLRNVCFYEEPDLTALLKIRSPALVISGC